MLRSDPRNPGHFREYTVRELCAIATELGFCVEQCRTAFYFDTRFIHDTHGRLVRKSLIGTIRNWVYRLSPAPLREGITMVWRKDR